MLELLDADKIKKKKSEVKKKKIWGDIHLFNDIIWETVKYKVMFEIMLIIPLTQSANPLAKQLGPLPWRCL